jgi:tetratricopeptide (TPR) repeat protein
MRRPVALATLLAFAYTMMPRVHARADEPPPQPAPAAEDPALTEAKAHFEAGRAAYDAHDYKEAVRQFRAAESLRPSATLQYNIALAYDGMGKPQAALRFYRAYVRQRPDAPNRGEVEARIAALAALPIETGPAEAPPQEVPPPQQQQQPQPPPDQQPQQAQGTYRAPAYYGSYDPYAGYVAPQPYRPAKRRSLWWIVFPIVGGVALTAGLIAWAVIATQNSTNTLYGVALESAPSDHRALELAPTAGLRF